jgi:pyruvate ferredoxin oxidoreductase gamma subunit
VPKANELLEIRWHGRGGQGTKTAVLLLAQAAILEGRCAQGFPEYGPERMGAPMQGYNRIADRPIRRRGPIEEPGILVVLDPSLLKDPSLLQGARPGSLMIVNTTRPAAQVAAELPELVEDLRVHVVDATNIARAETGSPIPNSVMLGALVRLTNAAKLESVRETITRKLQKKYASKESLLSGNLAALERGQKEVQ